MIMSETSTNERASSLNTLPLIPLDGAVVFPYTTAVLPLGKEVVPALEASLREGRLVLLAARRQELLETFDVTARLRKVRDFYRKQYTLLEVQRKLRQEVQDGAEKQQREFFLRQQLRAIQKELGEDDPEAAGLDDLREKLAAADLPENVRTEADREMARLERINSASPEYQMLRTYLEWIAELPWNKRTGGAIDVGYARQVLDEDHYGLEKIKERILEHLAVKQRRE